MDNSSKHVKEIFDAHNVLRTDPTYFVTHLEQMAECFDGKRYKRAGYTTIVTNEGATAVKDAIKFLKNQEPLHPLSLSKALCSSAQDHATNTGSNNVTGHTGADGSTIDERIERYCEWSGRIGENCSYRKIYDGGHEIVLA